MANYGKIDVLWYDVAWPLKAEGWESVELNRMPCARLQPDIIINNRSLVPEDFDTPEQRIQAVEGPQLGSLYDDERQLGLSQAPTTTGRAPNSACATC